MASGISSAKSTHQLKRMNRGSRNKKKNMRKNIDMSSVEESIDEKRFEERTGGSLSKKASAQLFTLDRKQIPKEQLKKKLSRKEKAAAKVPRYEQVLAPNKNIKAVAKGSSSAKPFKLERMLKEKKKVIGDPTAERIVEPEPESHVWDEKIANKEQAKIDEVYDAWLDHLRPSVPDIPDTIAKPESSSGVPVDIAAPGQSYNPTFEDHQALLKMAVDVEQAKLDEDKRNRKGVPKLRKQYSMIQRSAAEGIVEFYSGDWAQKQAEEVDESELGRLPCTSEALDTRKSKAKRQAEDRVRSQGTKQQEKKQSAKLANDIVNIKELKREIRREDNLRVARLLRKAEAKRQRKLQPRMLSKHKFVEPSKELLLTEELVGTLRQLKPEGNLLYDRLNSLRKRNIIETRIRFKHHRKYKPKMITTRSRKNFELQWDLKMERDAKKAAQEEAHYLHSQKKKSAQPLPEEPAPKKKKSKVKRKAAVQAEPAEE